MRIFFANEAGDVLIKVMQITAPKAQPWYRSPETATMANSSLVLNFCSKLAEGRTKEPGLVSLCSRQGLAWGAGDGYLIT